MRAQVKKTTFTEAELDEAYRALLRDTFLLWPGCEYIDFMGHIDAREKAALGVWAEALGVHAAADRLRTGIGYLRCDDVAAWPLLELCNDECQPFCGWLNPWPPDRELLLAEQRPLIERELGPRLQRARTSAGL